MNEHEFAIWQYTYQQHLLLCIDVEAALKAADQALAGFRQASK